MFTTKIIKAKNATVIIINTGLKTAIIIIVPINVSPDANILVKLLFNASLMLSISLVYKLIKSPWVFLSKYLIGSSCILLNKSVLILLIVFWATCTIILAYPYAASAPTTNIVPNITNIFASPTKSPGKI